MSIEDITNPLQYIECVIAFDSRDWSENNRLATIYAIVFGWSDEAYTELQNKFNWSDEAVNRLKKFHEEWKMLAVFLGKHDLKLPPAIDAVPVIHCKDCKHAHITYDGEIKYCDRWFPDEAEYLDGDYYCASAERKEK